MLRIVRIGARGTHGQLARVDNTLENVWLGNTVADGSARAGIHALYKHPCILTKEG